MPIIVLGIATLFYLAACALLTMSTSINNSSWRVTLYLVPPPEVLAAVLSMICCLVNLERVLSPWLNDLLYCCIAVCVLECVLNIVTCNFTGRVLHTLLHTTE